MRRSYLSILVAIFGCSMNTPLEAADGNIAIAIHGGAGTMSRDEMTAELEQDYRRTLSTALDTGYALLEQGAPGLDAIVAAIRVMEDSPLFNAGKGAVFTSNGIHELDASIMDGHTLNAGAVGAVRYVKNPIEAARLVMDKSPHVMLIGEGAQEFAFAHGVERVPMDYFYTEYRHRQLKKVQELEKSGDAGLTYKFGTVGAVALDKNGNLAAGTSTGGTTNKRFGRVGDSPDIVGGAGPDAVWRGMTTLAGSWIGGGANQAAMKEVFEVSNTLFSQMVAVDVFWANIWMAVLLFMAGQAARLDARMKADTAAIEELKARMERFQAEHARIPTFFDLMFLVAISFGITGLAHAVAGWLAPWLAENAPVLDRLSLTSEFFWIVVIATTGGLILSCTRARQLEGIGASRVGTAFLYVLIASIGMGMDVMSIFDNPGIFLVGGIWIGFHAALLLIVARIIRAPLFYMAVGSQANVGGAASAPVVASAFHPSLAPVGVLLAVLGYAIGTYAAWLCGLLMRAVAQ